MAIFPAPTYALACAAWLPTLVLWHADDRFTRLDGAPCDEYAAALAASWRLRPSASLSGEDGVRRRNAAVLRRSC